jgi:hypothetical protein
MDWGFYLQPEPLSASEMAAVQHAGQIDRERQAVERAHRRGDERALRRALARLHAREERIER